MSRGIEAISSASIIRVVCVTSFLMRGLVAITVTPSSSTTFVTSKAKFMVVVRPAKTLVASTVLER